MPTRSADRLYKTVTASCAAAIPAVLLLLASVLLIGAWPTMTTAIGSLFADSTWDVPNHQFGAAP